MDEIKRIRELLESISCHCAESVEFIDKFHLAKVIQKETLKAIAICDRILEHNEKTP